MQCMYSKSVVIFPKLCMIQHGYCRLLTINRYGISLIPHYDDYDSCLESLCLLQLTFSNF